ncbi:hypothetical protein SDC9_176617 [bioreactor metagenome]|uniref:Uncharacterized protein n=1 Tax=bioreactor metagenome TaxID=1076179 RepID=A0A645GSH6_9ZZZZ
MFAFVGCGRSLLGIIYLQIVGFGQVYTFTRKCGVEFPLEGLTRDHIEMVSTELPVIGQQVFHQCITVIAITLRQGLVAFRQIVGGTLNKCRYKGKILGKSLAVGEV